MSSNQEQEEEQQAGPSGVSREETLALLGLNMPEDENKKVSYVTSSWRIVKKKNCVMKLWIVLNVNELFIPKSFNRVEEDWIHKPPWNL